MLIIHLLSARAPKISSTFLNLIARNARNFRTGTRVGERARPNLDTRHILTFKCETFVNKCSKTCPWMSYIFL